MTKRTSQFLIHLTLLQLMKWTQALVLNFFWMKTSWGTQDCLWKRSPIRTQNPRLRNGAIGSRHSRSSQSQNPSPGKSIKLNQQGEEQCPHNIRVELTSENDLFFHYTHNVDDNIFKAMQESQKLMIEFGEYPNVLIKMLNSCIKEPHIFLAVYIMSRDGNSKLDLIQNIEYKFIELLTVDFETSHEESVRQ